jgi:hypothetical protein
VHFCYPLTVLELDTYMHEDFEVSEQCQHMYVCKYVRSNKHLVKSSDQLVVLRQTVIDVCKCGSFLCIL